MPEAEDLRRRARRAESSGEYRRALQTYRSALEAERRRGGEDAPDPELLARIAGLHARLDERRPAVDACLESAEGYAGRGQLGDAVAVCRDVLRAFPGEQRCRLRLAGYQVELGEFAEAREHLGRCLDAVDEGEADVDRAMAAVRAFLEQEPDQDLCLRAARVLEKAGRTGEALGMLQSVWEKRTGRRRPAGDIEKLARRLDPGVDIGSWTAEWPPVGKRRPAGWNGAGGGNDRPARGQIGTQAGRQTGGDEDPQGASGADTGDGADDGFVRRYDRKAGDADGERPRRLRTPGARDAPGSPAAGEGPAQGTERSGDPVGTERAAAGREADGLRAGLEVLGELLELAPDDPALRERKVRYARRLGDPELLEEALTELGERLAARGALRGGRLVYEEVLENLNPESERAAAGLRAVEAEARSGQAAARTTERPSAGAQAGETTSSARPGEAGTAGGEMDEAFRRRLRTALDRAPAELAHLQSAGRAVAVTGAGEPVPWWAHRELGRYLLLRGRPGPARRHLAAARDRAPTEEDAAEVLYHLGTAHRRAGDGDAARACFGRLARRDPGFAVAWRAVSG